MFSDIWDYLTLKLGGDAVTALLPIAGAIGWALIRYCGAQFTHLRNFWRSRKRALDAVARERTEDGLREGPGVWTMAPVIQPDNYKNHVKGARILAIANLKGGVGKTTLSANIGAYLADNPRWKKRVLLIDLDYQGSMSSMAFPDDNSWLPPPGADSLATACLSGDIMPNQFLMAAKPVPQQPRLKVITAHYDLAQADNRLLVEWLLDVKPKDYRTWSKWFSDLFAGRLSQSHEMRYNLAKLLHSEAVRDAFDLVIIDCPPRLTAGTIQALCASSHVLIPTILDRPSGESVITFCEQVETLKSKGITPHISYVGVAATRYDQRLTNSALSAQMISDQLEARKIKCGLLPRGTFIPQTVSLVREATEGIAFFNLGGGDTAIRAKDSIARLAQHVAFQVGVAPAQYFGDGFDLVDDQLNLLEAAE